MGPCPWSLEPGNALDWGERRHEWGGFRAAMGWPLDPLRRALAAGDEEAALRLLAAPEAGVNVREGHRWRTPLHVACRHDPPIEVVKCLLRCANVKNTEGATPLHVSASHRCSAEVIRVLIEDGPIACKKDKKNGDTNNHPTSALTRIGRAAIHYACMSFRGLSIGAFKVLLEATINAPTSCEFTKYADLLDSDEVSVLSKEDQEECEESANRGNTMTLRDGTGQTPLGLLFLRYRERVRCVINKMGDTSEISNTVLGIHAISAATHAVQADLGELWKKSRIIVSMMA